jgi:sugar/nucleoside kinase (ribokinase family)
MSDAAQQGFDIVFLGNYTKDTIVSAAGTRVVDGGAFNYGAHVAAVMGLRTAAITRLAQEDWHVVESLANLGVELFVTPTPTSTCLRLEYPSADVDQRVIYVTSTAGAFTPEQVSSVQARAFVVGGSLRGEVGLAVIQVLAAREALLAVDVQGFVRVAQEGKLAYAPWPQKRVVLAQVDILKTDAVEAEMLTGETDLHQAAVKLAELGPSEIVLTHRKGLLVHAHGRFHAAGFFPARLVGRSGRGDTCLAAYTARRLSSSPAEATVWAAAVTSLKMEAEGPIRREISEVEELVQRRYCEGLEIEERS